MEWRPGETSPSATTKPHCQEERRGKTEEMQERRGRMRWVGRGDKRGREEKEKTFRRLRNTKKYTSV